MPWFTLLYTVVTGDREVVGVVVRVEAVLPVVVHQVVGPHSSLVAVRVVAVVHVVDVGTHDVAVHVGGLEHIGVGQVFAEPADLRVHVVVRKEQCNKK